jgi:hypothetical protein
MNTETSDSPKPKFKLNLNLPNGGQLQAAVWENEASKDGESFTTFNATITRHFYDEDAKKWKLAKGFRGNDLLPLAFAAQELYRKIEELKHQ